MSIVALNVVDGFVGHVRAGEGRLNEVSKLQSNLEATSTSQMRAELKNAGVAMLVEVIAVTY